MVDRHCFLSCMAVFSHSYRYSAKAVRGFTPHRLLLPLLSVFRRPATQNRRAPPLLLLAAVLPFDSPARLRHISALLCSLRHHLLRTSPHLLWGGWATLIGWRVLSIPSHPRQAEMKCCRWRSSSLRCLALRVSIVRLAQFLLKVRGCQQDTKCCSLCYC